MCTSEAGTEPRMRQLLRGQQPGAPEPGDAVPCQPGATGFLHPMFKLTLTGHHAVQLLQGTPGHPVPPKAGRCSRAGWRRKTRLWAGSSMSRVSSRVASSCHAHSP